MKSVEFTVVEGKDLGEHGVVTIRAKLRARDVALVLFLAPFVVPYVLLCEGAAWFRALRTRLRGR